MTVAQELMKMTPEVNNSLLCRPGIITHWDREEKSSKSLSSNRNSRKKTNGLTPRQRDILQAFKFYNPARASDIAFEIGACTPGTYQALKVLIKLGYVDRDDNSKMYYLSGQKPKEFVKPTASDQMRNVARKMVTFKTSDLKKIAPWASVEMAKLKKQGLIESVSRGVWKWIGE